MKRFTIFCENDKTRKLEFNKYKYDDIISIDLIERDIRQKNTGFIYQCTGVLHNELDVLLYKMVQKAINNKSKLLQFRRWYPFYDIKSMTGYGSMHISPMIEYNDGSENIRLTLKVYYDGIKKNYIYSLTGIKTIKKFIKFLGH